MGDGQLRGNGGNAGNGGRHERRYCLRRYLNDAFGRLIRVEEPKADLTLAKTAEYTFDVLGRMTDAWTFKRDGTASQHRTFVYNTVGQLYTATNPENGTVTYTYTSDGLLATKTDAKSQVLYFFYDANHRLLRIESPQGAVKTAFTYDSATNGVGKMATASNDGHTWRYSYDIMGRVTTQTLQTPIVNPNNPSQYFTATAQYGFDYDGQLTNLYYPGTGYAATGGSVAVGTQHQYAYDAVSRPTSLQYYAGVWITAAQNAQYNAAGQITSWQESSTTLSRIYDASRGWVSNITAGSVLNLTYSYQPDGRVASVTDGVYSAQSASYSYDELNRLTSATAGNWAMTWTYDDFGNRTSQTLGGQTTTLAYNNNDNRITTGGYGYDANGNLTSMPGFSNMQYDVFDRLTSANPTSGYKYDAFGRRVWRWTPDASQHVYFYDMSGRLLSEFVVGGLATSYQYFAGQRIGQYTDRIGNVRYANGIARHYYPYGEEITGTSNDTYKFAQFHRDGDTGLDYAMNRYLASGIGRFLTVDPQNGGHPKKPGTWNRYSYVGGDPINGTDAVGLFTTPACGVQDGDDIGGNVFCDVADPATGRAQRGNNDPTMGGGNCALDGVGVACSIVDGLLISGSAVIGPSTGGAIGAYTAGEPVAEEMLGHSDCLGLFNFSNPMSMVGNQVNVVYAALGNASTLATTTPNGSQTNGLYASATITINTDYGSFGALSSAEAAQAIIHELMHAAYAIFGASAVDSRWVQEDKPLTAQSSNQDLVKGNCK